MKDRSQDRGWRAALWLLPVALLLTPVPAHAWEGPDTPACLSATPILGSPGDRVAAALASSDRERSRAVLHALADSLAGAARARPDDVDTQYSFALVMGARTEVEGGATKIEIARDLHAQLAVVLRLDPKHPGAQHLLGRMHAGVMRLNRVTRFLAIKLLGGAALSGASWAEAQRLMEAAVTGNPCVPEFHYELARLYQDRGHAELARAELERAVTVARDQARGDQLAKANLLLDEVVAIEVRR